jgi:hypothetical protein
MNYGTAEAVPFRGPSSDTPSKARRIFDHFATRLGPCPSRYVFLPSSLMLSVFELLA